MIRILLIDDEEDLCLALADRLCRVGFEVTTALDGAQGFDLAVSLLPDLILCDVSMPGLDGYTVLLGLRSQENTADIPFIFLTARATREEVRRGMRLGADDYLCKPVSEDELLTAVWCRLERRFRRKNIERRGLPQDLPEACSHLANARRQTSGGVASPALPSAGRELGGDQATHAQWGAPPVAGSVALSNP